MRRIFTWTMASLMVATIPVYATAVETRTETEESVESDDGDVEKEKSVVKERETDDDDDSTVKSTVESKKERVNPGGSVDSEVHRETEKTTTD